MTGWVGRASVFPGLGADFQRKRRRHPQMQVGGGMVPSGSWLWEQICRPLEKSSLGASEQGHRPP